MKIAVLDDYQSISHQHFKTLDAIKYHVEYFSDTLPPYNHVSTSESTKEQLIRRLEPFDIICSMRERTPFPSALLAHLPRLKLLLNTGVRNKSLDLEYCRKHGILVAGASDVGHGDSGPDSTTQHCVALILALARGLIEDDNNVKNGLWQTSLAVGLPGKTLGCLGLGRLGGAVANIMSQAFNMKVIAWSENLTQEKADALASDLGLPLESNQYGEKTFKAVSREELFSQADFLSVHLVLSERSRGLVTRADLSRMKPTAFFVNTSRGPIVEERDLLDILSQGKIRGAALDVFDSEPLPPDSKWRDPNWGKNGTSKVLLTPHMAYVEDASMDGFYRQQVNNIQRWENGQDLLVRLA